jgi:hypothetical protein
MGICFSRRKCDASSPATPCAVGPDFAFAVPVVSTSVGLGAFSCKYALSASRRTSNAGAVIAKYLKIGITFSNPRPAATAIIDETSGPPDGVRVPGGPHRSGTLGRTPGAEWRLQFQRIADGTTWRQP